MLNFVVLFHHNYQVQVVLIIIGQVFYLNFLHWIVFLWFYFFFYINLCHVIELMWLEVESEGTLNVTWIRCCLLEQPGSGLESNILGRPAPLRPICLQWWQFILIFNAVCQSLINLRCGEKESLTSCTWIHVKVNILVNQNSSICRPILSTEQQKARHTFMHVLSLYLAVWL